MNNNAWRHGARIVAAQPGLFALELVHYLIFYTLPLSVGLIMREIFDSLSGAAAATTSVWTLVALLAVVESSRLAVIFSAAWWSAALEYGREALLRSNMLAWLVSGPGARSLPGSSGEALSRFRDDVAEISSFMEAWIDTSGEMLLCIGAVVIMLSINVPITLVVVLPLILVVTVTDRLTDRIQRLRAESRNTGALVTGFMSEVFGSIQALKVAAAEQPVAAHLERLNERRRIAFIRDRVFNALLMGASRNVTDLGIGVTLLLAAGAMYDGTFTVGDFVLFASYINLATGGPRWVGRILARQRQAEVSIVRINELMAGAEDLALSARSPSPATFAVDPPIPGDEAFRSLRVQGLGYHYPGSGRGIAGIDLMIERGRHVVVTGKIGSGKTTLLRALLGLLAPDTGEIWWNDHRVRDASVFMVPPRCAYTPQVPRLFSESLRDNILMGRQASGNALAAAVQLAMLADDLPLLADGLDTLVGPRGTRLSGGQLQRAAAARMFVREPDVLVFDDLSSALDVDTERRLWQGLAHQPETTCLAVAHRREAIRCADWIIVMDDGRIAAQGTLEALQSSSDLFNDIWREAVSPPPSLTT